MAKFWVDFSGYCFVEAENEEDARRVFWEQVEIEDSDVMHEVNLCIMGIENADED